MGGADAADLRYRSRKLELCPRAERRLLEQYGRDVAVVVPYATFGNAIDLDSLRLIARDYGVAVVVDAASSLGLSRPRRAGACRQGAVRDRPFDARDQDLRRRRGRADPQRRRRADRDAPRDDQFRFRGEPQRDAAPDSTPSCPRSSRCWRTPSWPRSTRSSPSAPAVERAYRDALAGLRLAAGSPAACAPASSCPCCCPALSPAAATRSWPRWPRGDRHRPLFQPASRRTAVVPGTCADRADPDRRRRVAPDHVAADHRRDDRRGCARCVAESFVAACAAMTARAGPPRSVAIATLVIVGGGPAGTALLTAASEARRAARARAVGPRAWSSATRDRRRAARPLRDHVGFHRDDVPDRGQGQSASRTRRARTITPPARAVARLCRCAGRAAGRGRAAAPRDRRAAGGHSQRAWRRSADRPRSARQQRAPPTGIGRPACSG